MLGWVGVQKLDFQKAEGNCGLAVLTRFGLGTRSQRHILPNIQYGIC